MPAPLPPPLCPTLDQVLPAEPLLLMGAGPTPIPDSVARANGVVINHLGPTMNQVLEGVKRMGRYTFQTQAEHVIGLAGAGSAAMEMAIANLLWPGRSALCLVSGTFSKRLAEMAAGVGAQVTVLEAPHLQGPDLDAATQALATGGFDLVTMVQGETSCGVQTVAAQEIAQAAQGHGTLVLLDTVCTLSTMPMDMDDWGVDVCITGGQKGLSSIPGVSLAAFSDRAWQAVEARPDQIPHWVLDARRAWNFWGDHGYHYTAPVPGVMALYEALRLICEETLPQRFARHARSTAALQAAIEAMGLTLLVSPQHRLGSVLAICRPERIDANQLRAQMETDHGVQIAGAFGLDIVRIGQMGEQCRTENLVRTVHALGSALRAQGFPADLPAGLAALTG